jgi:excisionase family DNA binding protein
MHDPTEDVLDSTQAAQLLGCEPETVEAEARAHRLPAVKYGRGWRFPRQALLAVLNRRALEHVSEDAQQQQPLNPTQRRAATTRALHVVSPAEKKARRRTPPKLSEPPAD